MAENWTILRLLTWAAQDFSSRNIHQARLAAEVLLADAIGKDRVGLYLAFERTATEEELQRFRSHIEKHRAGMPVAYILGRKEFYSLAIAVNSSVLIPRPETELLVDHVIECCRSRFNSSVSILDVGCGSGAIAVAVKHNLKDAKVFASDVSAEALRTARLNAEAHQADIQFFEAPLLAGIDARLDIVVSNLPYLSEGDYVDLPSGIRDYEPKLALVGGEIGTELIAKLIEEAAARKDVRYLMLEIGIGQSPAVIKLFQQTDFSVESVSADYAGIPRVVVAYRNTQHGA